MVHVGFRGEGLGFRVLRFGVFETQKEGGHPYETDPKRGAECRELPMSVQKGLCPGTP